MEYSQKSQEIFFHYGRMGSDLYQYLHREDILVLLNRLPLKEYEHLRSVTFKTCKGGNAFGRVYSKRITGIIICDIASRISISHPKPTKDCLFEYGAIQSLKWPTIAVRRFMLYDVFLHELRHTQIIHPEKKETRYKIPKERLAHEYADYWRGELYQEKFDHPDPVHNLPSEEEKEKLQQYWPIAMKHLQEASKFYGKKEYCKALEAYQIKIEQMKLYHNGRTDSNYDEDKLEQQIKRSHHFCKEKK